MRLLLPISVSLALFAWQNAVAQLAPADDFFNSGAQLYISNNIPSALERVETGRKFYPADEKLKKLEELLKQQQQSQQDQSQPQQSQNDQKPQPQKSKEQKQQSEQQKQDEQNKNQADQKKEDEQKQQEQQKASADKQDKQDGEKQPAVAGQMTPEEAKRLLDAQKGNEQLLQLKPPGKPQDNQKPVKDW